MSRTVLVLVALVAAGGFRPVFAQQDAHIGTWKVNLAKSKYSPDPHYKSQIAKYEMTDDGAFRITADIIPAEGEQRHEVVVAKTDGKDYSVKGDHDGPGVTRAFTRIDAHTWQVVVKQNGNVLTRREVVAADGKTMTVTATGKNARGETVNSVVIYEKQ
jgi:hypothetical protein